MFPAWQTALIDSYRGSIQLRQCVMSNQVSLKLIHSYIILLFQNNSVDIWWLLYESLKRHDINVFFFGIWPWCWQVALHTSLQILAILHFASACYSLAGVTGIYIYGMPMFRSNSDFKYTILNMQLLVTYQLYNGKWQHNSWNGPKCSLPFFTSLFPFLGESGTIHSRHSRTFWTACSYWVTSGFFLLWVLLWFSD